MFKFQDTEKQYVLSLDSLDLTFMSQYVQKPKDEKRVLWSKPSLDGEHVYCQVEIVSDELRNEDPCIEPHETCLCHICNIDVPTRYIKQHMKSKQHDIYKKLNEKFLENLEKQMNVERCNNANDNLIDVLYCETCSKVVSVKHKDKHNSSNYHLKFIKRAKVANNFLEMYVDIDNYILKHEDNEASEYSDIETNCSSGSDTEEEYTTAKYMKIFKSNVVNNKDLVNVKQDYVSIPLDVSDEITIFLKYIKKMTAKYNVKYNMPSVEYNSIVIVTPKGYKKNISVDAFHSYKRMDDFVYCILCMEYDNTNKHQDTEKHVKNIIQPVNDYFFRESVSNHSWNHCLICNAGVIHKSNHAFVNSNHKKYNQPLSPSNSDCDDHLEITTNNLKKETESNGLLKDNEIKDSTGVHSTYQDLLISEFKKLAYVNGSVTECLICNEHVIGKDNLIILHMESKIHKDAVKYLLEKTNVTRMSSNKYYCSLCVQQFDNFISHIKSNEHIVGSNTSIANYTRELSKYVHCTRLNQSPIALWYRKLYDELLLKNNICQVKKSVFRCNVCLVTLKGKSEITHMFGIRHRSRLNNK